MIISVAETCLEGVPAPAPLFLTFLFALSALEMRLVEGRLFFFWYIRFVRAGTTRKVSMQAESG